MKKLLRLFYILKATAVATYKEWAAYRSHMILSIVIGPLYFIVQASIWRAVYGTRELVGGMTLDQILAYFGAAVLLNYLIMDFADWNLQMLIRTGKFLTFQLRPLKHRFYALSQKVGHRILGFLFEFLPVYALFAFVFKIPLVPQAPFWFVCSLVLSFFMMFLVNYSVGIAGFWFTRTFGLQRLFLLIRNVLAGTFLPLSFFPGAVQKILFFLPFQFITYVPIRVFLGSYELAGINLSLPQIVGLQAIAVAVMLGINEILWQLGVNKFTGVGA